MQSPETTLDRLGTVTKLSPRSQTPAILSSIEFTSGFVAPDYDWDRILVHGFTYSMTGKTGSGKTAIMQRLMAHTALGRSLAGREIVQGNVLMLAGENPDDVRMRWIALSEQIGFDLQRIPVAFRPGTCNVAEQMPEIATYAESVGGLRLVCVDTSAAFFPGDEENNNKEIGDHARTLRSLSDLPGNPTVLISCHPTKHARDDDLLPRGGGAFLAEVDGNLVVRQSDGSIELHWQGKFRGPDFPPMAWECITVESDRLVTSRGRSIPTVIARCLSDQEQADKAIKSNSELAKLIQSMAQHPSASVAKLAEACGWISAAGEPMKSKVSRLLFQLKDAKLAEKMLDKWALTAKGKHVAEHGLG